MRACGGAPWCSGCPQPDLGLCARCRALLTPLWIKMGLPGVCMRHALCSDCHHSGLGSPEHALQHCWLPPASSWASFHVRSSPCCPECCWALQPSAVPSYSGWGSLAGKYSRGLALTVGTCYGTFLFPVELAPGGETADAALGLAVWPGLLPTPSSCRGDANSGTHQLL